MFATTIERTYEGGVTNAVLVHMHAKLTMQNVRGQSHPHLIEVCPSRPTLREWKQNNTSCSFVEVVPSLKDHYNTLTTHGL